MIDKIKDFISGRAYAYRKTFDCPHGDKVLRDLATFCRAHNTTAHKDDKVTYLQEGRREVWLRIQQHLNLDDEQLWELFGGLKD